MSKPVLVITYYWPPSGGSGVQRWLKFCKYLPDKGIVPHVYTPENPTFDLRDDTLVGDIHPQLVQVKRPIWEPYNLAKYFAKSKSQNVGLVSSKSNSWKQRLMQWVRAKVFVPDPRVYWVKPSIKYLKNYLTEHHIDTIITTGPPHSMHLIGLGLKRWNPNLKWIADFRDPWSQLDFYREMGFDASTLHKHKSMESEVLSACDKVLATSHGMKHLLEDFDESKFEVITNGYDEQDFDVTDVASEDSDGVVSIIHAGLLNEHRNPTALWQALEEYLIANPQTQLSLKLAGVIDASVLDYLAQLSNLNSRVELLGYLDHQAVIKAYKSADILLLLVNNTDNAKANIPGKLFEYMAVGKPILAIGAKTADAITLVNVEAGNWTFDYSQTPSQVEWGHILKGSTELSKPNENYSRRVLTSRLAELINQL